MGEGVEGVGGVVLCFEKEYFCPIFSGYQVVLKKGLRYQVEKLTQLRVSSI